MVKINIYPRNSLEELLNPKFASSSNDKLSISFLLIFASLFQSVGQCELQVDLMVFLYQLLPVL